ncbi:AMP-binding protein [Dyadobacter chenhuakuii]|uniref:Long-chain-fatty-acid--CoA ligase n=1 Tax=Dyadobacter chenhuakuii TaxID=2909339 RepID=A0A9X1QG28_9BACT|nr:AMP-binding protein [Dyadobacter chenhuakuii]MCF2496321.1 AMP-binding protein [Dyadobacter chenhuakuii]MCF2501060.1 AMP-binding protein [Dyadobacter chenhuakuii]USJ30381.1 AMP-binding protein [Dyadobacter chenhuakuii]
MIAISKETYPWLKNYPEGIPYEINPDAYVSLVDMMETTFRDNADKPAYTNMDKQLTFGEVDVLSRNFAAYLQGLGLVQGDRIAIQMPNLLQYPVAMMGALRAGLIIVNTNPLYTPREMQHQFKDSGAKAVVILANFAMNLEKIVANTNIQHVIITEIGDLLGFPKKLIVNAVVKYVKKMVPKYNLPDAVSFTKALSIGAGCEYKRPNISGIDIAFIQYTGGTTGVSKGAMLTHRNLIANVEGINEWLMSKMRRSPATGQLTIVGALPLYHVFALTINGLCGIKWGALNILITNPKDLPAFVKELKKFRFHIFPGLNTLFNGLLNNPDFSSVDFSELKITIAGGMALQKVVAERWEKVTGCPLVEGYGLSETSPVLSVNPLDDHHKPGTIGLPFPSTEMRILKDDETWAAVGEKGEICARGPQIMLGYYNRPDETVKVIFEDESGRWFKTGDIGYEDADGFFKIVDRKKDMILVSGFNVYPNEIEDVVAQCPGVMEVACVGVPDEKSGELVKIYVVKKDPALTEEKVKAFCKENLTGYKIPRQIEFRNELPKTNVGKILRRALREEELAKAK